MIGIDIVAISRIEEMLKKFNNKALKKYLNDNEIKLIKSPQTAAGFWAAKEAFSKAIGTGIGRECSFLDIEIKKNEKGKPYFADKTLKKFNLKQADLSISHDGNFAIAAVIVFK
jgi:holo-[acyl-carrier protein] synthase